MKWLEKKINRTSIRSQMMVTMVIGMLVLLVSLIIASTWVTNRQLRQLLINQGMQTTASLAESSVLALLYHSPENADAAVKAALSLQGVAAVTIYTDSGVPLLHAGKPAAPENLAVQDLAQQDQPRIHHEDDVFWYYLAPVIIENSHDDIDSVLFKPQTTDRKRHLGYVYVVGSKTSLDRIKAGILLSNASIALVIGLVLLYTIQLSIRRLIQPLDRITDVMKKVEQGDFVPEANIQGPLEIHHITGAYNRMIKALTDRDRELRNQNIRLEKQAIEDHLTGLINRVGFEQALKIAIEECQTLGLQHALCYMDLDKFKIINDTCGHNAGDILLQNVSSIFRRHIRKDSDTLARVGGDEFTLLLKNCPIEKARMIGEAICRDIEDYRYKWGEQIFSIGVSIGIVPLDEHAASCQDVLKLADSACYLAKEHGRGRVHVIQADNENLKSLTDTAQIARRIEECLDHDLFEFFCQPLTSLNSPSAGGERLCELLLRIPLEEKKFLLPGSFMPVAERYNMEKRIDRWVVRKTLEYLAQHAEFANRFDVFSINITSNSMLDDGFIRFLEDVFAEFTLKPERLCLEIIETDIINNLDRTGRLFAQAHRLGYRIAIDDFNISAASTGNLQNMKIDYLKIDGSIINDIKTNPVKHQIVKSINEIARLLGMKTVAKHIENAELVNDLAALGVDYAQGYALMKPVPIAMLDKPAGDYAITG